MRALTSEERSMHQYSTGQYSTSMRSWNYGSSSTACTSARNSTHLAHAVIGDLHVAVDVEQHVVELQVAVDDTCAHSIHYQYHLSDHHQPLNTTRPTPTRLIHAMYEYCIYARVCSASHT